LNPTKEDNFVGADERMNTELWGFCLFTAPAWQRNTFVNAGNCMRDPFCAGTWPMSFAFLLHLCTAFRRARQECGNAKFDVMFPINAASSSTALLSSTSQSIKRLAA